MNSRLRSALQSAQWACGAILDAEFYREFMDASDHLSPVLHARQCLMEALDNLSRYEYEIRASGPRSTGEPGVNKPPSPEASGPVGRGATP